MLMEEVAIVVNLVLVDLRAECDVHFCFLLIFIVTSHPLSITSMCVFVEFVQHAEISARRTPNDKQQLVLLQDLPSTPPICISVEVESIRGVERRSLS